MCLVDAGNNVVVKFNAKGRIVQALGRRLEPWVYMTHGIERAIPAPASFYQPTDTVVGPDGSTYVTDGYGNSRVAKFTREGTLVKYWGDRGTRPGQFNTPHSIVMDRNQNLYVADRQNSRIQVFDTNGQFKQEWDLDGLTWSMCITPRPPRPNGCSAPRSRHPRPADGSTCTITSRRRRGSPPCAAARCCSRPTRGGRRRSRSRTWIAAASRRRWSRSRTRASASATRSRPGRSRARATSTARGSCRIIRRDSASSPRCRCPTSTPR